MAGFFNKFKKQKEQELETSGKVLAKEKKPKAEKPKRAAKVKKAEKVEKNAKAIRPKGSINEELAKVIIRPHVSEKSAVLAHSGQYVFIVNKKANQIQVAQAIKAMYGVQPIKVNIANYKGKKVRFGRIQGRQKDWKKAVVSLPKGTKIDVYEGV